MAPLSNRRVKFMFTPLQQSLVDFRVPPGAFGLSKSMESGDFKYLRLPSGYIRLLKISSTDGLTFHCTLHRAEIANLPAFYALSYVWGSGRPDQSIFLDGKEVKIRQSLLDAFYALNVMQNILQQGDLWF